jgi:putative endonuclease
MKLRINFISYRSAGVEWIIYFCCNFFQLFKPLFMTGFMYILECINGAFYTGSTKYLALRYLEHLLGLGSNFTRKYPPIQLLYYEEYPTISLAFEREKQVQGWRREKKMALMNGDTKLLPKMAVPYYQLPHKGGFGTSAIRRTTQPPGTKDESAKERTTQPPGTKEESVQERTTQPPGTKDESVQERTTQPPGTKDESVQERTTQPPGTKDESVQERTTQPPGKMEQSVSGINFKTFLSEASFEKNKHSGNNKINATDSGYVTRVKAMAALCKQKISLYSVMKQRDKIDSQILESRLLEFIKVNNTNNILEMKEDFKKVLLSIAKLPDEEEIKLLYLMAYAKKEYIFFNDLLNYHLTADQLQLLDQINQCDPF